MFAYIYQISSAGNESECTVIIETTARFIIFVLFLSTVGKFGNLLNVRERRPQRRLIASDGVRAPLLPALGVALEFLHFEGQCERVLLLRNRFSTITTTNTVSAIIF